jgi:LmbE family N-acetylglucosaminyl deacetylase
MVLAPHPDDETLGAGALIAQTASSGHLAALVYLTDGSGSHAAPGGLAALRKREAGMALFRLTGSRKLRPIHLDWKDAAPAAPESITFARTVAALSAMCRRLRVDAIAVTARHEPHCDHAAAAKVAYAVRASAKRPLIVAEYCVWAQALPEPGLRMLETQIMPAGKRKQALRAHRSQLTPLRGPGFHLPVERQRMATTDTLLVRCYR